MINYTYNGLTTSTQFVPADRIGTYTTNTIEKNALGQKVKTSTNGTNEVQFDYDPFGNLVRTTDPDFNTVEMGYDIRGRKTKMDDPDQGVWTYTYYADGALRSQKDANTKTVVNYYDKLGRMTSRVQPEGTSNWSYDTCTMGTGKLCSVTDNSGFTEIYTYNNLGLPHTTTTKISGQSDMVHSYTYDDKSRVETVTYPAGFKIKNHYNSLGFKEKVTDDKLGYSRGYVLWEAKEINAKGQVELFKQGSLTTTRRYNDLTGRLESQEVHRVGDEISSQTYKWLSNGNLDWKTDKWKGRTSEEITDYYGYDSLNRLTSTQTIVGSQQRSYVTLDYDALGNITYKSDVGTYTYTGSGGPHAVSNITGKGSYTYDANGNMRTGDGREIFYTSFNKPNKIKQNGNTTNITYGPDRKRYKRVDVNKSTIYYAGAYEKEIRNGATIHRVNIGDFAMMEIKSGVKYTFLNIRDHLGSLIGTVKNTNHHDKRYSFDPWGKRRTVGISYEMLQLDYTSMINAVTQRGFTGHEHLSNVGLIHMNGRVYDPELARFLSADPFIQSPDNLQSHNRYSYVWNNPLNNNDPSGYWKISIGGGIDIKGDTPYELKKFERELIRPVLKQIEEWLCSDECHIGANSNGDNTDIYFQDDDGGKVQYTHQHERENHSESRPNTGEHVLASAAAFYNNYYASQYSGTFGIPGFELPSWGDIARGLGRLGSRLNPIALFASLASVCGAATPGGCGNNDRDRHRYGPYYRYETNEENFNFVLTTQHLYGRTPNNDGLEPTAQAYRKDNTPYKKYRIEFYTEVEPDNIHGPIIHWSGVRDGIIQVDQDTVAIPVEITSVGPVEARGR